MPFSIFFFKIDCLNICASDEDPLDQHLQTGIFIRRSQGKIAFMVVNFTPRFHWLLQVVGYIPFGYDFFLDLF